MCPCRARTCGARRAQAAKPRRPSIARRARCSCARWTVALAAWAALGAADARASLSALDDATRLAIALEAGLDQETGTRLLPETDPHAFVFTPTDCLRRSTRQKIESELRRLLADRRIHAQVFVVPRADVAPRARAAARLLEGEIPRRVSLIFAEDLSRHAFHVSDAVVAELSRPVADAMLASLSKSAAQSGEIDGAVMRTLEIALRSLAGPARPAPPPKPGVPAPAAAPAAAPLGKSDARDSRPAEKPRTAPSPVAPVPWWSVAAGLMDVRMLIGGGGGILLLLLGLLAMRALRRASNQPVERAQMREEMTVPTHEDMDVDALLARIGSYVGRMQVASVAQRRHMLVGLDILILALRDAVRAQQQSSTRLPASHPVAGRAATGPPNGRAGGSPG